MKDKNFLVIDDDIFFRERLAKSLSKKKYQVSTAKNYLETKDIINNKKFNYAIIDLNLNEEKTGLDILELIKTKQKSCQIVLLTGYGTINTTVRALKAGANNMLTKPATLEEILNAYKNDK